MTPFSLLHFFNVHIMNVYHVKFPKSLIVEQFQENYLKAFHMYINFKIYLRYLTLLGMVSVRFPYNPMHLLCIQFLV